MFNFHALSFDSKKAEKFNSIPSLFLEHFRRKRPCFRKTIFFFFRKKHIYEASKAKLLKSVDKTFKKLANGLDKKQKTHAYNIVTTYIIVTGISDASILLMV